MRRLPKQAQNASAPGRFRTRALNAPAGTVARSARADVPPTQERTSMSVNESRDMNRDPITGAPGSHPLGTGVGAASGALAGAAVGSLFGPIGTLIGGAIGTVGGGAAG